MCNSAVAASDARNNDDVIDGHGDLSPFCLTPTSGTAGCLQPHGDDRWRSFGSTTVPSLAGFLDPTLTTGRGHASSGRDPPKSLQARQNAYARRLFRPAEPLRTGTVSSDSVAHIPDRYRAVQDFPCATSSLIVTTLARRLGATRKRSSASGFSQRPEFWPDTSKGKATRSSANSLRNVRRFRLRRTGKKISLFISSARPAWDRRDSRASLATNLPSRRSRAASTQH